jgi:hypothetical protein
MTVQEKSNENSLISKAMLLPQEEMLEVKKRGQKIKIGIPSDFTKVEYRVPLTPQAVDLLVSYGHLLKPTPASRPAIPTKPIAMLGRKLLKPKRKSSSAILFCGYRLSTTMKLICCAATR